MLKTNNYNCSHPYGIISLNIPCDAGQSAFCTAAAEAIEAKVKTNT